MNNRKKYGLAGLFGGLAGLWMIFIFSFSNQDTTTSNALSGNLVQDILQLFYQDLSDQQFLSLFQTCNLILRKITHFSLYLILAVLLVLTFSCLQWKSWIPYVAAAGGTLLFAVSDEFHQLFVAGRTGSIWDVGIDMAGAVLGIGIVWGVRSWRRKKGKGSVCSGGSSKGAG